MVEDDGSIIADAAKTDAGFPEPGFTIVLPDGVSADVTKLEFRRERVTPARAGSSSPTTAIAPPSTN